MTTNSLLQGRVTSSRVKEYLIAFTFLVLKALILGVIPWMMFGGHTP